MEIRFKPLDQWPQESTADRRSRYTFRTGYEDTLSLLRDEVWRAGGDLIVIEINVDAGDIRNDGWPRANATPTHPGVIVSFDSDHGPLRYLTDQCEFWQHNLRSIALGLTALRAVDRYGISTRGEQYRGWSALPPGTPLGAETAEEPMTIDKAGEILAGWLSDSTNLRENAAMCVANKTYRKFCFRQIANELHPDKSPADADVFKRVNEAYHLLEKHDEG